MQSSRSFAFFLHLIEKREEKKSTKYVLFIPQNITNILNKLFLTNNDKMVV